MLEVIYIYIYIYVCVCVCVCVYIYIFSKNVQNNGGHLNFQLFHLIRVVGITACYRLGGWSFETWWVTRSSTPVQTGHKASQLSFVMGTGALFQG